MLAFATGPHDGDVADVVLEWGFAAAVRHGRAVVAPTAPSPAELGDDGTISFSLDTWSSAVIVLRTRHRPHPLRTGPPALPARPHPGRRRHDRSPADTRGAPSSWSPRSPSATPLSLGLAYFDLVSVPAWVVEPAISLSIVAAAVLAIRGRGERRPAMDRRADRPRPRARLRLEPRQPRGRDLAAVGRTRRVQHRHRRRPDRVRAGGHRWHLGRVAKFLDHRIVWVRTAVAASAAVVGVAWTVTRLAELPI